ncbi:hypothetical protein Daus18300_011526 [Diaporthe australafricana]|uniref:NACHT domain-containing protein n=1 Tax=Diaporthe australafricana TaxID=127596 RepID=A0ABR3W6D3_9PEZI
MALEITGLTIGAMALTGTFKDCIDVFGMIVAARSLNDDVEVLRTKLDVEKMLLLQWADRIGLAEPRDYDQRLDDPDLKQTISSVLDSIKRLLSDGKELKDRYGLADYQDIRHDIVLDNRVEVTASSTRLQKFIERFSRLSLHTDVPRREYSTAARFKWVIRDKIKFSSLMDELSYFVSRLNALVPAQGQSIRIMTEEDFGQIRSIPLLKFIVMASASFQPQVALIAQQAIRSLNQGRVLDRLWFRWIDDRKTNIHDRHFRTLDWALSPADPIIIWDSLSEWLRCRSGLYWLAGKAGSGKSTLMKFLSDHPQTTTLLKEWAGPSELFTMQFFFYALGRSEQKSQEGALRSLLFQFLDKHRNLIGRVFPVMWKEAIITEDQDHDLTMPSISEMEISLLQLAGTVSADKKFCIMIDGLDEFEGKHSTLAAFLSRLERLPNVKILVSSRPLPVFVSAFGHVPKMYLQDLTSRDIETYINDTILHHPRLAQVSHIEQETAVIICEILMGKASGVFLWVILACRSVLEGLDEYDTVPELIDRIKALPPELGDFFRQIMAGLDPRKRDQSARLLRLVFESQTSPYFDPIPTMGLAIVDEQGLRADFMGPNITGLTNEDLVLRCQRLEGRLRSRCSGLVEIQADSAIRLAKSPISAEGRALVNSRVEFMHKSLYDFFCMEGTWEWEVLRVNNECGRFEPHLILASLWAQVAGVQPWGDIHFNNTCFNNALVHNVRATATDCPTRMSATNLSRLQYLSARGDSGRPYYGQFRDVARQWLPHQPRCRKGYEDLSVGLALAAEAGMVNLVNLALEDPSELRRNLVQPEVGQVLDCSSLSACPTRLYQLNKDRAKSRCRSRSTVFPLLYHATCRPFLDLLRVVMRLPNPEANEGITVSTAVVKYLLEKEHDPDEEFYNTLNGHITTPWIRWLKFINHNRFPKSTNIYVDAELVHHHAAVTMLFVDAGAELGTPETYMYKLVDECLSEYISRAAKRGGGTSVEWARSDDLWLKVRDAILSLRTVGS